MTERYPTKPIDVVMEILSDDQMGHLFEKCAHYSRIGIGQIFVLDFVLIRNDFSPGT